MYTHLLDAIGAFLTLPSAPRAVETLMILIQSSRFDERLKRFGSKSLVAPSKRNGCETPVRSEIRLKIDRPTESGCEWWCQPDKCIELIFFSCKMSFKINYLILYSICNPLKRTCFVYFGQNANEFSQIRKLMVFQGFDRKLVPDFINCKNRISCFMQIKIFGERLFRLLLLYRNDFAGILRASLWAECRCEDVSWVLVI